MRKFFVLFAVSLLATAAVAQTEKGSFRVGGISNLKFSNLTFGEDEESTKMFDLGLDVDYFIWDRFALGIGTTIEAAKNGEYNSTTLIGGVGGRYYLPFNVFIGSGFEFIHTKESGYSSAWGTGLGFNAGYSVFVSDHFAIEPALLYLLGLSGKEEGIQASGFSTQIGLSYYF